MKFDRRLTDEIYTSDTVRLGKNAFQAMRETICADYERTNLCRKAEIDAVLAEDVYKRQAHCRRVGDAALRPERLHQGREYRPGADRA